MGWRGWLWVPLLAPLGCGLGTEEVSPYGDASASSSSSGGAGPATATTSGTSAGSETGNSTTAGPGSTNTTTTGTTNEATSEATGTGLTSDGSGSSTGIPGGCTLDVLIHDPFDNGDPATGGGSAILGGVRYDDNGVVDGTLTESGGIARFGTPLVDSGTAPNVGIETIASFDGTAAQGVTAVAVIDAADTPIWQGIVLALHRNDGFYVSAGTPGLELHVFGTPATGGSGHNDSVVLIADAAGDHDYADLEYDAASLNDGFVVAISASPSGWRLRAESLTVDDSVLTAEGSWTAGFAYADLLDADSFAAVAIQGQPGDPATRTVNVDSLTVFSGVCGDNVIPSP